MRLWRTSEGVILTDEQLLQRLAADGGLAASHVKGDVVLICGRPADEYRPSAPARSRGLGDGKRGLAERLEE